MRSQFSIAELAEAFQVSRSGYYAWLKRQSRPGQRAQQNQIVLAQIRSIYQEHQGRYGSPRIWASLRRMGFGCGRNRVVRLMKLNRIRAKHKRGFRPRTTEPGQGAAPNLLAEVPAPRAPDQIWVSDITYVPTRQGWLYVAAVMDLFSRRIVGWHAGPSLEASLVEEALKQAWQLRRPAPGLLHHSDRGIQYTSSGFLELLRQWNIIASMSHTGHCYDNATMEAFWSTLKSELVHGADFYSRSQAIRALFEYLELYYNRKRLHSALGYRTPVEYEGINN
jgi:transposase InsO family protein